MHARMLSDWLLPQLETIEDYQDGQLHFQQDGAPPHWALTVRDWLNRHFDERWIGRDGPIRWPPRSPDLTPLDYWLWGDLKRRVYAAKCETIDQLKQRITDQVNEITAEIRLSALADFLRRLQVCIEKEGAHVEV
jgi:hypothetical protein